MTHEFEISTPHDTKLTGHKAPRLPWTTQISERALFELSLQEASQVSGRFTKVIHIMPMWDGTRIGFILNKDHVKQAYDRCSKYWKKLSPGQRMVLLEKMSGDLEDEPAHIQDIFHAIANKRTRRLEPNFEYVLYLCHRGIYSKLHNPFDIQFELHPLLGKQIVSLDSAIKNLMRTAHFHLEDELQHELLLHSVEVACKSYEGKFRKNGDGNKPGEPFSIHPIEVTTLLIKVGERDLNILVASLFHDLEDAEICSHRPIHRDWVSTIERKVRAEFRQFRDLIDPFKISNYIRDVSKPDVDENGIRIEDDKVKPKRIMHENANKTHGGRVIKAADHIHNILTADVLSSESRGRMIPRSPEFILPFLGKPAENEKLSKRDIAVEERLRDFLLSLRPQLLKLTSELHLN